MMTEVLFLGELSLSFFQSCMSCMCLAAQHSFFVPYCSYIIRSDPLAHVPENLPGAPAGGKLRQDYGSETRDETHL